jgi:polygalacturonase
MSLVKRNKIGGNMIASSFSGFSRHGLARRRARSAGAMLEALEGRWLLSFPPTTPPVIPAGTFLVTSAPYNAVGNGVAVDTAGIQKAINDCVAAGGGTVEIPFVANTANVYLTNELVIPGNNVNLQVDTGVTLQALAKGSISTSGSGIIAAKNVHDLEITGGGTIDGNGASWWPSANGPNLIVFNGVNNILFNDVHFNNSPHEHLVFQANASGTNGVPCNNVTINNVTILTSSTSPNTDGMDPCATNMLIENCNISDGDDDIVAKPQHGFVANITVQNCTIGYGHGISVGGQTNAGMFGMIVTNCTFDGTDNGLRLKAGSPNGNLTSNISYSNITMVNVPNPIFIDSYYAGGNNNIPTDPTMVSRTPGANSPTWMDISYSNIVSSWNTSDPTYNSMNYASSNAGSLWGLPSIPINGVTFNNVQLSAFSGMQINFAVGVTFDASSHITVDPSSPTGDLTSTGDGTFPTPYQASITLAGFTNQDIGAPTVPLGTSPVIYDPDSANWAIQGDGAGIGAPAPSSDQFNYSYETVVGDQTVSAQLLSLTSPGAGIVPAAGVMYRSSTNNATDPFAAVVQTTGNQLLFEYRATPSGAVTISAPVSAAIGAEYMQVVRSGSTFTGEYSTDGSTWTTIASASIADIGSIANAGLAVAAGNNSSLAPATFAHVSVAPTTAPAPAVTSFSVNGGAVQRSMDTLVSVLFNQPVDLSTGAITLTKRATGGGSPTPMTFTLSTTDNTTFNLTFPSGIGASLPNGIYDLTVTAADVTSIATSTPMTSDQTFTFHRLFGDVDGNGIVNNADYFAFKQSYAQASGSPNYNAAFDFDGNGIVNNADYFQFKLDYGMQFIY